MSSPNRNPAPPPSSALLTKTEIHAVPRRVTFENAEGTFKILLLDSADGPFRASGNFFGAGLGENIRLKGKWFEHPKHGWTFQAESFLVETPTTEDGLRAYLS